MYHNLHIDVILYIVYERHSEKRLLNLSTIVILRQTHKNYFIDFSAFD